jgi:two-component system, cell cycle response regulator DivK
LKNKILYIEDNDQNFYLVNFILNTKGYEVTRGCDGQEGIDLANEIGADLILLDIQLPVMDGYIVAQTLRKNPRLASIPIIALTSYAMMGDREKALESGCNGYIEKPINPETFVHQIEQYLS